MKTRSKFILSGIFFVLFVVLIVLLKTIDVQAIGPAGTEIGFAGLNQSFHELTGEHLFWYHLTEVLGILAILLVLFFAFIGFLQLLRGKSLKKVDYCIVSLGGLYVAMGVLYVLFEKVIINYRPILEEGSSFPEASFPSSHTMLVCVVFGSAMSVLPLYIKKNAFKTETRVLCLIIMALMVIGRLLSGVHWLTDIIGGVLISAALVFAFLGVMDVLKKKRRTHH